MRTGRMKRGFTLIETVVTVGIIAAMAAVVIPQVARQFDTGDFARLQNDLKNLQTGIETFNVNVKALPGDIDDLVNVIDVAGLDSTLTSLATGNPVYTATQDDLWKGPYVDASMLQNASPEGLLTSGTTAQIADSFVCYAAGNNRHGFSRATSGTTGADDVNCPTGSIAPFFLAIQVVGVVCDGNAGSTFMVINEIIDGANESGAETNGRIRCEAAATTGNKNTTVDVVWYLATPIS
ncbi:MAG TPA: type II secretion system protein [Gemmatimonadaceae bacterium]|nr:type II secretion system protein [Gemmatimonadaceae bacterium]